MRKIVSILRAQGHHEPRQLYAPHLKSLKKYFFSRTPGDLLCHMPLANLLTLAAGQGRQMQRRFLLFLRHSGLYSVEVSKPKLKGKKAKEPRTMRGKSVCIVSQNGAKPLLHISHRHVLPQSIILNLRDRSSWLNQGTKTA